MLAVVTPSTFRNSNNLWQTCIWPKRLNRSSEIHYYKKLKESIQLNFLMLLFSFNYGEEFITILLCDTFNRYFVAVFHYKIFMVFYCFLLRIWRWITRHVVFTLLLQSLYQELLVSLHSCSFTLCPAIITVFISYLTLWLVDAV